MHECAYIISSQLAVGSFAARTRRFWPQAGLKGSNGQMEIGGLAEKQEAW